MQIMSVCVYGHLTMQAREAARPSGVGKIAQEH